MGYGLVAKLAMVDMEDGVYGTTDDPCNASVITENFVVSEVTVGSDTAELCTSTVLSVVGVESGAAVVTWAVEISEIDSVTGTTVATEVVVILKFFELSEATVVSGSTVVYDADAVFCAVLVSEIDADMGFSVLSVFGAVVVCNDGSG